LSHKDTRNIIAICLLIFLYALVPLLLFLLAFGALFDAIYLLNFIQTGDIADGALFIVMTIVLLGILYLVLRLMSWLKK